MKRAAIIAWAWLTLGWTIAIHVDTHSWKQGRCGIENEGFVALTIGWPVFLPATVAAIATGARYPDATFIKAAEKCA